MLGPSEDKDFVTQLLEVLNNGGAAKVSDFVQICKFKAAKGGAEGQQ